MIGMSIGVDAFIDAKSKSRLAQITALTVVAHHLRPLGCFTFISTFSAVVGIVVGVHTITVALLFAVGASGISEGIGITGVRRRR